MITHTYVDTNAALAALIENLIHVDRIALDTEADSLHRYHNKVCLMQLSFGDRNYIVDPFANIDLAPLLERLSRARLILHGADFDLRMMRLSYGFIPQCGIFDTMLAAQLLGFPHIGLASLVKDAFDVNLSKQGQTSDWSRRPLTAAQKDYAAADTHYLGELARGLEEQLFAKGRLDWHEESCNWLIAQSMQDNPKEPEKEWRVKGWSTLDRRELAFLREIWRWREREAQSADSPPFKVMDNHKMTLLAQHAAARSPSDGLTKFKLPRNCVGKRLEALARAIERAHELPQSNWPRLRLKGPRRLPRAQRSKELLQEVTNIAHELGIVTSVLASRATIDALARAHPTTVTDIMVAGPTMRWQAQLLEPAMLKIFKG